MAQTRDEMAGGSDVLTLLSEQRELCRRLNWFAETQRALITGEEPERLIGLLGERQQVLDRLTLIGRRLKPLQKRWQEVRAGLSAAQAIEADELIAEVNRLLAGILRIDEADAQLLSARKSSTAQALTSVGHGRQAGVAYAASTAAPTHRMDWTDE